MVVPRPAARRPSTWLAAVGADGIYVPDVFMNGGPYNGFCLDGSGLLISTPEGGFEYSLGMLRLWQGLGDFTLLRRCEASLRKAKAQNLPGDELEKVMDEITYRAAQNSPWYSDNLLRTTGAKPSELEAWRERLIRAAANLAAKTPPARK